MKHNDLFEDVFERRLINEKGGITKSNLEKILKNHLRGVIRPPALCFGDVLEPMSELNLANYEVSQIEPLHDLKGHIKNIWEALPSCLTIDKKKVLLEEIETALGPKDTYRGCDYRLSLITVYERIKEKIPSEIRELLYTLKEISRLAYQKSVKRSPKTILRLYNMSFLHASRCQQVFGKSPKLSKIYGIYYHSLTVHLPEHARIVAPSSLFTESEERIFNALRGIGKDVSNRYRESVKDMGIVR